MVWRNGMSSTVWKLKSLSVHVESYEHGIIEMLPSKRRNPMQTSVSDVPTARTRVRRRQHRLHFLPRNHVCHARDVRDHLGDLTDGGSGQKTIILPEN
jgi:hypothetical protein